MNMRTTISALFVVMMICLVSPVLAGGDDLYQESFPVPAPDMAKATSLESFFLPAQVDNTATTGHGNVQFKVMWNTSTGRYQLLIWSKNSYYGCTGYRQWFDAPAATYFDEWPRRGGALCVGWPPTYSGMNSSMQLLDVDGDGDLDVFQLAETAPEVWTVYLFKNLN
jgi:hypothetical protein